MWAMRSATTAIRRKCFAGGQDVDLAFHSLHSIILGSTPLWFPTVRHGHRPCGSYTQPFWWLRQIFHTGSTDFDDDRRAAGIGARVDRAADLAGDVVEFPESRVDVVLRRGGITCHELQQRRDVAFIHRQKLSGSRPRCCPPRQGW